MHPATIDWAIMGVYFAFVLGVGYTLRRYIKTSTDYFLSGRSIPAWVAGLAFLSANLGAQEVIGMAASGAKYGMATSHFYWIGAIPAMVFLGVFMMPFYYGSKARSVPEYLKLRFDAKTRGLNAISFAVMTVPLFATFLLGMFWKRSTGHGAFVGLLSGTLAAALHHGLTLPTASLVGIKGGWLAVTHHYPSEMAQNFWTAIWAFSACFAVTILVSLCTRARPEQELVGLVYSLTPRPQETARHWYERPAILGAGVLAGALLLNLLFW